MVKLKHRFITVLKDKRRRIAENIAGIRELINDEKARILCGIVCTSVLCFMGILIYSLLNVVTVQDPFGSKTVVSLVSDQNHLLRLAGFVPKEDDVVLYTTFPERYTNITIKPSFEVPITVDGTTVTASIQGGTVEDCLKAAGVLLGQHDYTSPSLHSPVDKNTEIRVYRVEYIDNQYEETVPYGTQYKTSSLTFRFKKKQYVLSEGQEGKNLVTYRERYVDGEMESALVTNVEVVKKPVDQLVLKYENKAISPLSAPSGVTVTNHVPSSYKAVYQNVSATGYSSKGGKGASGLGLYCGTVAVNPNIIPYGSKLYIASPDGQFVYGWAIATDTGTACMDGRVFVDLYYDTYKESSLNWKNVVNVYVVQ